MNYDCVIIGSSPVCMLEAVYHQSKGEKTGLVDSASQLGGAWKTLNPDGSGIENVEIGCHIFEKDKKVFRFWKNDLGLAIQKLEPQPKVIFTRKEMAYNLKNFFFILRDVKTYFTYKHGFRHLGLNIKLFFTELFSLRQKYYTLENASVTLTRFLEKQVEEKKIDTLLSKKLIAAKVDTKSNNIALIFDDQTTINTKKLIITFSTFIPDFFIDGKKISIFREKAHSFVHLHLLIEDKNLRKFTYLRVFKNEMLHRVSDMSGQMPLAKNQHLICVGIFAAFAAGKSQEELNKLVMEKLKNMQLVSKSAELLRSRLNTYTSSTTDFRDLQKIESLSNGMVETLYTSDTMWGIRGNLHKYKTVRYD